MQKGRVVARVGELSHGMTKKFLLTCQGRTMEALLLNHEGEFFAYVNRCCHLQLSLDWVDNHFFSADKCYLICANHGATYEPTTGECVWGPCFGAFLEVVPLVISKEKILAYCPEEKEGVRANA